LGPAATWHFGPEFGREHILHLLVCGVTCTEERYKLVWSVAPFHVEGKQTAVLAADVTNQALQLFFLRSQFVQLRFMKATLPGTNGTMP